MRPQWNILSSSAWWSENQRVLILSLARPQSAESPRTLRWRLPPPCQKLDRPQRAANSQGRKRVEGVGEQVRATDFMLAGTRGRSFSQGPESSRTSVDLGRKASFLSLRTILQAARRSYR